MANRRKDAIFQADMSTFSSDAQARINDLRKDGKAKDSRMDEFQAQLTKIDVRSLSNEKTNSGNPEATWATAQSQDHGNRHRRWRLEP